jgi:hypothetical protein
MAHFTLVTKDGESLAWGAETRSLCCGDFVFVDESAE